MVILGSRISAEYFSKFFFVDTPRIEYLGKISLNDAAAGVEKVSADLMIVESSWGFSHFLVNNGFFLSPRVDFVLDIKDSLEAIQNRITKKKAQAATGC